MKITVTPLLGNELTFDVGKRKGTTDPYVGERVKHWSLLGCFSRKVER